MNIQLAYGSSADNAPAGFKIAMAAAVRTLDALITNNITVTFTVGYGTFQGQPLHGAVSEGGGQGIGVNYGELTADLRAHASSAADASALAALPASDPTNGGTFLISGAEQKAWGLLPADAATTDGEVGFGDGNAYDFSTDGTTATGKIDFVGVAEHELTHALGRVAGLQFQPTWYTPFDLFRYSAAGSLQLVNGQPAYFSVDGGATALAPFATTSDPGDWAASAGPDSFDSVSISGTHNPITAADIKALDVLGFNVPCFVAGTRIATARGLVAVEALAVGEVALTPGGSAPVVWLGHRRVDCRRHPRPQDVWPIRVQAHAFGRGRPSRDLWLSPDHAVFWRGALIPIRYLANGASVTQLACDTVTYWHVELPRHDVLLAEGLPTESYLDTGNRGAFVGAAAATQLHPVFARAVWQAQGCAPLLLDGPRVIAARRHLLARAERLGHRLTDVADLSVMADGRPVQLRDRDGIIYGILPAATEHVRLHSRRWVPAHAEAASCDTRVLGIAVGRLWLDDAAVPLDDARLDGGWHATEGDWRWTDGAATLRVAGARVLRLRVAMTGRYWLPASATAAGKAVHGVTPPADALPSRSRNTASARRSAP
jgi:Hint domain